MKNLTGSAGKKAPNLTKVAEQEEPDNETLEEIMRET